MNNRCASSLDDAPFDALRRYLRYPMALAMLVERANNTKHTHRKKRNVSFQRDATLATLVSLSTRDRALRL